MSSRNRDAPSAAADGDPADGDERSTGWNASNREDRADGWGRAPRDHRGREHDRDERRPRTDAQDRDGSDDRAGLDRERRDDRPTGRDRHRYDGSGGGQAHDGGSAGWGRAPRDRRGPEREPDGYGPDGFGRGEPLTAGSDEGWVGPRFRVSGAVALWLPVVISFVVQVPASLFVWRARHLAGWISGLPADDVARVALALAGPLLLIGARRFPGPVVAATSAAAGAYVIVVSGDSAPPYIALAFAVVGAVVRGARVWAWISLAAAWVATITAGLVLGVDWPAALVVAVTLALVLMLALGESIRTRRRRYDELRRRIALRRAGEAQAERVRIARELHDVLAHSLSQINVQAGVGLHLIDSDPAAAATALANIKSSSKQALDEVRSVLGILRSGPGSETGRGGDDGAPLVPEPDLSRLPALVDTVRAQGLQVALTDTIDAARTPRPVQLALYRIVQESLTNVLRHARAHSVEVSLRDEPDAVTAMIVDDGAAASSPGRDGTSPRDGRTAPAARDEHDDREERGGRGLLGMRERAELLGGRLEAGPVAGGGFRVRAVIPLPSRTARDAPGTDRDDRVTARNEPRAAQYAPGAARDAPPGSPDGPDSARDEPGTAPVEPRTARDAPGTDREENP